MAIFGIETAHTRNALNFFNETSERLKDNNMINNPFTGGIKQFSTNTKKLLVVFDMSPVYPNFSFMGWPTLIVMAFFFQGFSLWLLLPIILILLGIFWSSYFFYFMAKLGLRKKGYLGSIRMLKHREIIEGVIFKKWK